MKKQVKSLLILLATTLAIYSCHAQKTVVNREVDTTNDGKMLLGYQTKSQLLKEPYSDWYTKEHDEYKLDEATISALKKAKLNSYGITVVLGTWCSDSHREVPRLMKILEATNYPESKLKIVAVNRKKESPGGEEGAWNIQRVPTVIVEKYGKEIRRVIEMPQTGFMEKDLLDIIKKSKTSVKDLFKN